jgi:hypothetical protein
MYHHSLANNNFSEAAVVAHRAAHSEELDISFTAEPALRPAGCTHGIIVVNTLARYAIIVPAEYVEYIAFTYIPTGATYITVAYQVLSAAVHMLRECDE